MFKYLLLQQSYMGCCDNLIKNIIVCFKLIQFVLNELNLWMFRLISPLDGTFNYTFGCYVWLNHKISCILKKCMLVTFFTHAFIYVKLNMSIHINIFHRNTIPQSRCTKTFSIKLKHTRISWSTCKFGRVMYIGCTFSVSPSVIFFFSQSSCIWRNSHTTSCNMTYVVHLSLRCANWSWKVSL